MLRRFILPVLILIVAFAADTALIPMATNHWLTPMATLVAVNCFGLLFGRAQGIWYGLVAGLAIDVTVNASPGMWTATLVIAGAAGGLIGRKGGRVLRPMFSGALVRALLELAMLIYAAFVSVRYDPAAIAEIPARIALDAALVPAAFLLLEWVLKPDYRREAARLRGSHEKRGKSKANPAIRRDRRDVRGDPVSNGPVPNRGGRAIPSASRWQEHEDDRPDGDEGENP